MFRDIIGGLLIVLILITGFISYIILFDVKEVRSPSLTLNTEQYNTEVDFQTENFKKELINPFISSVAKQSEWLENHSNINNEYNGILEDVLFNQNLLFIEEYKNDVENKKAELTEEFQIYQEQTAEITAKEVKYYSSIIENETEQSIDNIREKYNQEFQEYEKEVRAENRNELLNYRLKLEVLDLSEEKAQEYRDKIEEIEAAKQQKIRNQLTATSYKLRTETEQLIEEKEAKITELKERLNQEMEQKIAKKKASLDNIFQVYQQNRLAAVEERMAEFEDRIAKQSEELYQKRDEIALIVKDDLASLKEMYPDFNEERD